MHRRDSEGPGHGFSGEIFQVPFDTCEKGIIKLSLGILGFLYFSKGIIRCQEHHRKCRHLPVGCPVGCPLCDQGKDMPPHPHDKLHCLFKDWIESIDWLKGKNTGKSHISWKNLWFPVGFPSLRVRRIIPKWPMYSICPEDCNDQNVGD